LLNLEAPYRFGRVSGFVNIDRHLGIYSRNLLAARRTGAL
jgi:hypothetical protein